MRVLELNQMESIEAGDAGDVINGVCAAVATASYFGWIVLSNPVGYVIGGVCLVNVIGNGAGWW